MRTYSKSGPFGERPFYTHEEIERTCSTELRQAGFMPDAPSPVRIDRFVEKRFGVALQFDVLPAGILGYSSFGPKGLQAMVISSELEEDTSAVARRRVNATIAHEAGHGLFQAHLFLDAPREGLFGDEPAQRAVLCRHDAIGAHGTTERKYDGKWWEYQANQAIGPLLMPRELVLNALKSDLRPAGMLGIRDELPAEKRNDATRRLADVFDVNPAVARIRLDEVFGAADAVQLTF
jgi:hypothetical protein